jgi:flavin-dependent dehydrogenase
MSDNFDVVIVGGRVAGSTLAAHLAKQGVKVCVIERDDLKEEPVSTNNIYYNTVDRLVNQTGVDYAQLMSSHAPALLSLKLEIKNGITATFPFPGPSYCIRRSVLDNAILDAARRAGAEIRLNTRVTDVLDDGQRVIGVRTADGEVRARFVVGADGVTSMVARAVQAETWLDIPSDRFCYFSYYRLAEGLPNDVGFFCFDDKKPGPCGYLIFPVGENQVLVGCFPVNADLDKFKNDPDSALKAQLSSFDRTAAYLKGEQTDRVYSRLKMPSYMRRSVGPGWALVGDSGHFKDPVLAQGIGDAVHHAIKLASAIKRSLDNPGSEQAIMDAWERDRDLESIDILFMGVQMSRGAGPGALVVQLMEDAMSDPKLLPVMGGIYQRTHRPADFFNPKTLTRAAIRAVLKKRASVGAIFAEMKEGIKGQRELDEMIRQIKSRPMRPWTLTAKQ